MSNYLSLKATINANIKTNNNQEITGEVMNSVLNAMVDSLGVAGYQYRGVVTPSTNPGTPDQNVWYLAAVPGTYTHFGGKVVGAGLSILATSDGGATWIKYDLGQNANSFYGLSYESGGYVKIENGTLLFKGLYLFNENTAKVCPLTDGVHSASQDNSISLTFNTMLVVSGGDFAKGTGATIQAISPSLADKSNYIILGWYLRDQKMIGSLLQEVKWNNDIDGLKKSGIEKVGAAEFQDDSLFIPGTYIDKNDGNLVANSDCATTGLIPVKEEDVFFYKGWINNSVGCCVAGYDSSMAFTGILLPGTALPTWYSEYVKIVIPSGVSYVRASGIITSYQGVDFTLSFIPLMGKALTDVYPYFEQFKGKKVLFFGDSYTELDQYTKQFEKISGCVMYNRGVGGTTYGRITSQYYNNSLPNRCDMAANDSRTAKGSGLPTSVDAVFILAGVNDWGRVAKTNGAAVTENLGPIVEPFGDWKVEDDTTFCGGCRYVLRKVKAKYPTAPIFVILPVRAYSPNRYPSYNEFTYADPADEGSAITLVKTSADDKTFNDYRDAIRHIAHEYGLPVIDPSELGFSPAIAAESSLYYTEGLHLNAKGMALLGDFIYKKAMSYLTKH